MLPRDSRSSHSGSHEDPPSLTQPSQTVDIFSQFPSYTQASSPILQLIIDDDDAKNATLSSELGDIDAAPDSDLTVLPPPLNPVRSQSGPQFQWPSIGWDLAGTMETWIETLQTKGDAALIELLIQADKAATNAQQSAQSPFLKVSENRAKINGTLILANFTMDTKIALIRRILIQRYDTEAKRVMTARLPKWKDSVQIPKPPGGSKSAAAAKEKENRPSIYAFFHANQAGVAPSKRDYEEVIRVLRIYLDEALKYDASARNQNLRPNAASRTQSQADIDLIQRVDSYVSTGKPSWSVVNADRRKPIVTRADIDDAYYRGARRYITTDNTASYLLVWINAMEELLRLIPAGKEDDPIPWHVSEVGWTVEPIIRIGNHERHTSSNDILNVVEAVAGVALNSDKYGFRQQKLQFRMRPVILYHVPAGHLVSTAEHLFSLLLRSYVWQGGLNAVVGGNQVHSRKHVLSVVWERWEEKMPWGAIRTRYRADGEKMQEQWELREAVGLCNESKAEREVVRKKHEDAQRSLKRARQNASPFDREVEEMMQEFVQVALQDAKTAKAARDARELTRDLIDILKKADIEVSAPYQRGLKALSAARSRAFGHSLDLLLKDEGFWRSEVVSMDDFLPEINARTATQDFVTEEAWVALNAMQYVRPPKIRLRKTADGTVILKA